MSKPKVPRTPPKPLEFRDEDVVEWSEPMFRIHRVAGRHPARWDQFRTFGPIDGCRWDHHPNRRDEHPDHGILYAASNPQTALAEVFQDHRLIRITNQQALAGWSPARPLQLLDLASNWPVRNQAGRALVSAPRSTCRSWARVIADQAPNHLDGMVADSTLTGNGARILVLWGGAHTTFPAAPIMWVTLDSPAVSGIIVDAADETGYRIG